MVESFQNGGDRRHGTPRFAGQKPASRLLVIRGVVIFSGAVILATAALRWWLAN